MESCGRIIKIVTVFALMMTALTAHARVIPPTKPAADNIGLIFVQGLGIDVNAYEALAVEIQRQAHQAVWIALVNFPLSAPNPLLYSKITDQARTELKQAGMPGELYYVVGHSLGGTVAQSQDVNLRGGVEEGSPGVNLPSIRGMILLGSYVTRSNQFILRQMPLLTIGGELDGMSRIGRIAESYARQLDMAADREAAQLKSPVVVLPGVNHRHFFTGTVPWAVGKRDLNSALPEAKARQEIARVVSAFLGANLLGSGEDAAILRQYVQATDKLVRPLIDAMWLEGSYHLMTPCTSTTDGAVVDQNHCQLGSHWAERAAEIMAGDIVNVTYHVENVFHESWRMFPFFHAHILNSCTPGQACVMRLDNSGQNVYSNQDNLDTAFDPAAAQEMRVKMKSRQSILQAAGYGVQDFSITDEWNACATINQQALAWAEAHAPAVTLQRYHAAGLPLTMGADMPQGGGPTFIWSPLKKTVIKRGDGSKVMEIKVQTMRTALDNSLAHAAGYHYCKLVSPAWFMEWIYTDSLRPH